MKTDDKKTDMVARNNADGAGSPFKVQKPAPETPSEADQLNLEVQDEESELNCALEDIAQRQAGLAEKKARAIEAKRQQQLNRRTVLLEDAADFREIARSSPDADRAKDFIRKAKEAEAEASRIGVELNLVDAPAPVEEAPTRSLLPLSSNKAMQIMIGLFALFVVLTYVFGAPVESDPTNAVGISILKNAPIRALLSFTLTFLTVLVAVFLIRICFPPFYRIWHNRIDSERSLESLLNEAPAWAVLLSLLALFYTFMQLFASFYQAMYA